jgi:hypothetical protein
MPQSLLPPRGVFIPAWLIYNRTISPAALHTYAQLRGLAWGKHETPPISLNQLAEITGKSRSSLYGHMALLRSWGALRWRPSEAGTLIVSFSSAKGAAATAPAEIQSPESRNLEKPDHSPPQHDLELKLEDREGNNCESSFLDSPSKKLDSQDGKRRGQVRGKAGAAEAFPTAANVYRRQTGIAPNPAQRALLANKVRDLKRWDATLGHWLAHGWNPRNIAGQIELYQRGGPSACLFCQSGKSPLELTIANLSQLREELRDGNV